MKKRIISFILAVIMVIGLIPVNVFADELEEFPLLQEEVEEVVEELPEEVTEKLPEEVTEKLPEEKTEEVYEELEMPVFFTGNEESEEKTSPETANVTPTTVKVNFTAQAGGAFLLAPQYNVDVSSDEAEKFGYTDSVSDGVSALDVLVKAHELKYVGSFTAETKVNYLDISEAGYVTTIFNTKTGSNGFVVNGGCPNDGTASGDGYHGTTVTTTLIHNNDTVEFFIYQDTYCADNYTYVTSPKNAIAGTPFTVKVEGLCYGWNGYKYKTPGDMKAAATAIEGISIATVNTKTGEVTDLNVETDEKGDVALTFAEAGEYMLTAYGTDDSDTPVIMSPVKVTVVAKPVVVVNVAPKTVDVTFKKGDTALTDSKVKNNGEVKVGNYTYHQYILTNVPVGEYSYRAKDGETDLGGMSFTVDEAEEQSLTLVRTNFYTADKSITDVGDYAIEIMPGSMQNVVTGAQYIDDSNRVVTPTLLWANGNGMLYNWVITLKEALAESKGVALSINNTFADTLSAVQNKTFTLSNLVNYEIIAPEGAEVKMFNQLKNFNVVEVPQTQEEDAENGNIKHVFRTVESTNLTYRVSMNGKITRAGYMGTTEKTKPIVITFDESENPENTKNEMDSTAMQSQIESSTLLNVNCQNDLALGVGETFRLRAYRGAWQIVNSVTANIMIEPDFHYNVISGEEHISMTPAANRCTGNAGNNWMDIKGVSEGIAIIEVSYDAIIIGGSGTTYSGQYGATDPNRKSIVVIDVSGNPGEIVMKAKGSENIWDTELDTVYTLSDTAALSFTATLDGAEPAVELSTDKGATWKAVEKKDGYYVAEGLVPGNNILRFTNGTKTNYQVVRAAKVTYTVTNTSRIGDVIYAGDTVEIVFKGIYQPAPKISGIYNPGFGGKPPHAITYNVPEGIAVTLAGGQYDFISTNKITATFDKAGEFKFTDGNIHFNIMGVADPIGGHRVLTDAGVGANFNAVSTDHVRCIFPDLTFTVSEKATICEHEWGDCIVTKEHSAAKAGEKRYTCQKCGEYKLEATKKGACAKFAEAVAAIPATGTTQGRTAGTRCSECLKVLSGMEVTTNPEAVKDLMDKDTGKVSIDVKPGGEGETAAIAVIPAATVKAIQSAAKDDEDIKGVSIELGEKTSVSYDAKAFEKIVKTLGKGAEISLELGSVNKGDVENLNVPEPQKKVLKEALSGEGSKAELVQIELTVNDKEMSDFGGGKATVTVPYKVKATNIIVERVEANGTKTPVPSWLNADGSVSFETGSHSFYLINEVYQITLDANGGYVTETLVVTGADGIVPTLPDAVLNKYRFVGWFSGEKEVKAGNKISANVTLKAHWEYDGNTTTVVIGKRDNKEETKEVEENPNTGAPVPDFGMSFTVLGAICLVLFEKKKG